ncbi:MAG: maleylpyruvate isomerase family mycothiol-dependent enzyme [Acidimicrobiales bacterium]
MSEWNFMDPASKENVLRFVRQEADGFFALASPTETWEAPTGAGHWQVRDVVGHMVDTTETYFIGFDAARGQGGGPESRPLTEMQRYADEGAQAFRGTPPRELLDRLETDLHKMLGIFEGLTDEDWTGLTVPHKYMGPLPALFYPIFQLVDYTVHSWDLRQGTGRSHVIDGDAADLLAPLCFVLWQATARCADIEEPFTIGIRVSGRNAGDTRVTASPEGLSTEAGTVDDLPLVLEFDPASFVLTAFGRTNAGTARGDRALAERYCNLFFRI